MTATETAQTRVVAAGATGFIGKAMVAHLLDAGLPVTVLTRSNVQNGLSRAQFVEWQPGIPGDWQKVVADADVVINLAGASVAGQRWTPTRKTEILRSRVDTTNALVSHMTHGRLVSASAVGFYGDTGNEIVQEDHPKGADFLAGVCQAWEDAAQSAINRGIDTVIFRIGVVLGSQGGALAALLQPPFLPFSPWRFGLGGPLGSGKQWMPWIHINDVVAAFVGAALEPKYHGIFNLTAPNPVTNSNFSKELGRALNRPAVMPVPAFLLQSLLGEFAYTLITGQRAIPARLMQMGFTFSFPTIHEALKEILMKR